MPCSMMEGVTSGDFAQSELRKVKREFKELKESMGGQQRSSTSDNFGAPNDYEAAFCGIISELERRSMVDEIIKAVNVSGKIDIQKLIDKHKSKDKARLKQDILQRFSRDEIELIKQMANEL